MKLKSLFISAAVMAATLCTQAQNASFNVATYNLRQQNGNDDAAGNGWEQRAPIVAQLIQFHDFDIFGTQEGFKHQLDDLQKALPGYSYIGVGRDDGHDAGEHSAIFYRDDLFDMLDHGDFWLSETPAPALAGMQPACASAPGANSAINHQAANSCSSTCIWIMSAHRHVWKAPNS